MKFIPSFVASAFAQVSPSSRFALALLAGLFLFQTTGCAKTPYVWANEIPAERAKPDPTRKTVAAGDVLFVTVVGQVGLTGQQVVGVDGTIALPNVGAIQVLGQSQKKAAQTVTNALKGILAEPQVSVVVVSSALEVSVLGEVAAPGKYHVRTGDGVTSALALAGGTTEFADEDSVYLVREGEALRIRFRIADLVRGGDSARSFALKDGDLLIIE